jgi:predicted translin family RNA/ssDNA-binding protein
MLEQRLSEDEVEHLTVFNELLEALYKWYMNFSNYSINFHVKFSRYNTDCTAYAELAVFKASI